MAIPTSYNSWQKWTTAGNPVGDPLASNIRVDNPASPTTYEYCDGATKETATISLWISGVTLQSYNDGNDHEDHKQRLVVSASTVVTTNVVVNVDLWIRQEASSGGFDWIKSSSSSITIPSGTDHKIYSLGALDYYTDFGGGVWTRDEFTYILVAQTLVINCAPPAPSCTLEITGTTNTNPTFQGGSDGSIEIFVSGSTGTTMYSVNAGTPQVSNIFSGLPAGFYDVEAVEGSCYDTSGVTLLDGEFRTGDFTVSEPNDYVATENPIVTTLSTTVNSISPQQAISTLTLDSGLENDYSVRFNLTSPTAYDVTFTAKDFPNRENFFTTPILKNRAGTAIGINTDAENATSLAEAISNDINLSRWYFIDVVTDTVTLTSKENSASLTLNSTNVEVLDETGAAATTGITLTQVQAGVDAYQGSLVDDYSLYVDVYVGDGNTEYGDVLSAGTYNNFTTLELPFSQDNIHQFDVSEIMKTFVYTPKPDYTFTGFTRISTMLRPFYVSYGEKYPLVANTNTKKKRSKGDIGYKWSINSALQWEDANNMDAYFTGGTFLTNSPNPLDIQRGQTNFLYFILPKDIGTTLTLKGDIDFYDGTSTTGVTFIDIASGTTNVGGVYILNVSYDTLGLAAYEASGNTKVKRCTFGVYSGAALYSEERTYRFEIDEQPRKFGVSFENKLGGYDTFDFVGVVENTISRTAKNYTIPREIRSDGSSPQGFKNLATYDTKVVNQVIVNSGWIDEDHFDWLRELLESNNIYSYSEVNQNYLNVGGYTYKKSSLDDLYEMEVTFNHTIFNNSITV